MKYFISGLMAIFLIGCSSLLKFDKSPISASSEPPVDVQYEPQVQEIEDSSVNEDPAKPMKRKSPAYSHPQLEIKDSDLPKPCRNISDDDIYQEVRMKLTCIEENVKK